MGNKKESPETNAICLLCDKKPWKRGLCKTHYQRFIRGKNKVPESLRNEFEELAIQEGKLLPQRNSREIKEEEFSELAKKLLASKQEIEKSFEQIVDKREATARKQRKRKPKHDD